MKNEQPWYISQRAEALALVHLTVRNDLNIIGPRPDQFPNFQVWLGGGHHGLLRFFGVEMRSKEGPLSEVEWRQLYEKERNQGFLSRVGYPLCLLLIDTITDEVRWTWLLAPISDSMGIRLELPAAPNFEPVTRSAVDRIVQAVERFYDTLSVPIAA